MTVMTVMTSRTPMAAGVAGRLHYPGLTTDYLLTANQP
jgi:hypothetical protein